MNKHLRIVFICMLVISMLAFGACSNEQVANTDANEKVESTQESAQPAAEDDKVADSTDQSSETKAEAEPLDLELHIAAPAGAPTLSMLKLHEAKPALGEGVTTNYDIIKSPDALAGKLTSGELDIAVVPSNLAIKLYNKGVEYQYAGSVVWGVLYIVSTEDIASWDDVKGKEIFLIGRGLTPDIVTRAILKANGLDPEKDVTLTYVNGAQELAQFFIAGKSKISLMPEPMVTKALMKQKEGHVIFDLQQEWAKVSGLDAGYPQASIIVKKSLAQEHPEVVNNFLALYDESVDAVNANPEEAGKIAESLEQGLKAPIVTKAIPKCYLDYRDSKDSKEALEAYYQKMFEVSPKNIGGKMPDEGFYYQRK